MTNQNNKYCGQCGKPNPVVHKFCSSCGGKFEGINPEVKKEDNSKSSNSNRKATITGAVAGAAAGYTGSRLAQTVDKLSSESDTGNNQASDGSIPYALATNDSGDVRDAVAVDMDNDGVVDAIVMDHDGDGIVDAIVMDFDNDGVIDAIAIDNNNDGIMDQVIVDADFDGKPDTSYTIEENKLDEGTDWEDFF